MFVQKAHTELTAAVPLFTRNAHFPQTCVRACNTTLIRIPVVVFCRMKKNTDRI